MDQSIIITRKCVLIILLLRFPSVAQKTNLYRAVTKPSLLSNFSETVRVSKRTFTQAKFLFFPLIILFFFFKEKASILKESVKASAIIVPFFAKNFGPNFYLYVLKWCWTFS